MSFSFSKPQSVDVNISRWSAILTIIDELGGEYKYVFSADSAVADSGLYFGTLEEYEEDVERY